MLITGVLLTAVVLLSMRHSGSAFLTGGLGIAGGILVTGLLCYFARALERSEDRLRVIVDSAQDGIITTDANGIIESVNASVSKLFGYRSGQITGSHLSALLASAYGEQRPGESLPEYLARQNLGAIDTPHEVTGLRYDGQQFHMEFAVSEAEWGGQRFYSVMIRDISERVAARRMLSEAKDELERRVKERTAALEESNMRLHDEIARRKELIADLQAALGDIKTLTGLLPICSSCKKIRDDKGYWSQIEEFIREHSDAEFSHGICPDCIRELYPELHGQISDS